MTISGYSVNPFLESGQTEGPKPEFPLRVFAYLDQSERLEGDEETYRLYFDCVDARWIINESQTSDSSFAENVPIFILEVEFEAGDTNHPFHDLLPFIRLHRRNAPWISLAISKGSIEESARLYWNLFSEASETVHVVREEDVARESLLRLSHYSLAGERAATDDELVDALMWVRGINMAAVYDVGQGSCGALLDEDGVVIAYLDFGGGVQKNAHTFPGALGQFCFSNDPPIILSHWDWDHWSSALRDTRALSATWIVPRQRIGLVHWTFVQTLRATGGNLLIWPSRLSVIGNHEFEIRKCTGKGRNHSGLAVVIRDCESVDQILFPGDARYSAIPGVLDSTFSAIVVPHHGGWMSSKRVPSRSGSPDNRLVYSFGPGNTYNHALPATETNHRSAGWAPVLERRTSGLRPNLGHIGLPLSGVPPSHSLPCGGGSGGCDLQIVQF
jgi:hypothetical protein